MTDTVEKLLDKGVLVSPDMLDQVDENTDVDDDTVVLEDTDEIPDVEVMESYDAEPKEWECTDFVNHYGVRYETLSGMLRQRQDLDRMTSVQRVLSKEDRDQVSVIGLVTSKRKTKNDHYMLTVEDKTGTIKVLVTKDRNELYEHARNTVLDEVIGVTGGCGEDIIFADSIVQPEIPLGRSVKKAPEEEYAVFISDVEVGSENFLEDAFEKFLAWINGKSSDKDHKRVADKVKYLFIPGDLVAGVGVYPGQEDELTIPKIKGQYEKFAKYMQAIPDDIEIIICAGNHDAGRIAEPQPAQYTDIPEELAEQDNITLVSNPSTVRFGRTRDFPGFTTLLYHGYSLPYYAEKIPEVRNAGGQDRSDLIMEYYLKWRHLAPTHTSNMYIPDGNTDPLIIDTVPDFLATGHIHRTEVGQYRGTTLLNCSAWTAPTEYQEKRGLTPEPGRSLIVNLHTRKVKVLNFWQ